MPGRPCAGAFTLFLLSLRQDEDGRVKRAFTPDFDGPCPAMTVYVG